MEASEAYDLEWGVDDRSRQRRWPESPKQEELMEPSTWSEDWAVGDETLEKRLWSHYGRAE